MINVLEKESYNRDYIPNFAIIMQPVIGLTNKRVILEIPWRQLEKEVFESLKRNFVKMPF